MKLTSPPPVASVIQESEGEEEAESPCKQKATRPKKGSSKRKQSPESKRSKGSAPGLSIKHKLVLLEDCGNSAPVNVQTKSIGMYVTERERK